MTTKTLEIAIFAGKYGHDTVHIVDDWMDKHEDYVRLTESVEVEFTSLDYEVVLGLRLANLDREIESVRAKAQQEVDSLKNEKQRLMAIEDKRVEEGTDG